MQHENVVRLICAATARLVPKIGHLNTQRHTLCAAASPATSLQSVAEDVDASSCSTSRQDYSQAAADELNQRMVSGTASSDAQPASSELHSSGSVGSSELLHSVRHSLSGVPKQPKKVIPWPTAIRACEPLPADPMTWQNAAVLIDKPLGWTSFDVCAKLRAALRIKKVPPRMGIVCRAACFLYSVYVDSVSLDAVDHTPPPPRVRTASHGQR
jgi:hypothetical protein